MRQLRSIIKKIISEEMKTNNLNLLSENFDPSKVANAIIKHFNIDFNSKPVKGGLILPRKEVNIDIPVSSLPKLLQPCFRSITLNSILAGINENNGYRVIKLSYSWKHPSGSNGLSVELWQGDYGKTWKIYS